MDDLITLEKGNYRQWSNLILTHLGERNLLSYLFDKVPCPSTADEYCIWKGFRAAVFRVIFENVDDDFLETLIHFECPHALWTHIREVYEDHDSSPSLEGPLSNSHVLVHSSKLITHACDPLEEIADASEVPDSSSYVVESLSTTSDSLQHVSDSLPNWDSYLTDIASLFVESHILDLEDQFEGLSLLFDDSHGSTIVTSCLSLELVQDKFPLVAGLSQFVVIGHVPDWIVASSSSYNKLATHEQISETQSSYIWIPLPTTSYPEWESFLHLYLVYLLPKGRNIVCRHWIMFCLQTLTMFAGDHTLWGGYLISLLPSYGGVFDCIYMMHVVLGGYH